MSSEHKLAAILFADISGYTAMMQKNEQNALALLIRFKEVLEVITPKHQGRIVQYFGDGCLLAFDSSTNCVDCAIGLQKTFSDTPSVPVRIGMHQGDVIFKNGNVFGDGVNIASRIESLGIPGAILMSKTIRDQVKNQKEFLLVSVGSFDFKNVEEKMEVFALANPGFVVPKREEMHGKLKNIPKRTTIRKWIMVTAFIAISAIVLWLFIGQTRSAGTASEKSIAVLYFDNMTGDPDQEYFCDGITEAITSRLGNIKTLDVRSRNSAFVYKGKSYNLKNIAKELNVNYILEGSVRKSGNTVKITAQLIDGRSDAHFWSDDFTRELKDIFELQSDVALAIAQKLEMEVSPEANAKIKQTPTSNIEAYENFQKGYFFLYKKYFQTHQKEDFERTKQFFEKAIQLDPNYAEAYAGLAELYDELRNITGIEFPDSLLVLKEQLARKALQLNPKSSYVNTAMAFGLGHGRLDPKFDSCFYFLKQAYYIDPTDALTNWNLANILSFELGLNSIGVPFGLRAVKADPLNPVNYMLLGCQYANIGKDNEAKLAFLKSLELTNERFHREPVMLIWLAYLGELKIVENRLQARPEYTFEKAYLYACKGEIGKIDTAFRKDIVILLAINQSKVLKDVIKIIDEGVDKGDNWYEFLSTSFYFDAYRADPDFKRLLEKTKRNHNAYISKYGNLEIPK